MKASKIGPAIKRLRRMKKERQVDIAKAAGISQSVLSKYETGELSEMPFTSVVKILKQFGIRIYLVKE